MNREESLIGKAHNQSSPRLKSGSRVSDLAVGASAPADARQQPTALLPDLEPSSVLGTSNSLASLLLDVVQDPLSVNPFDDSPLTSGSFDLLDLPSPLTLQSEPPESASALPPSDSAEEGEEEKGLNTRRSKRHRHTVSYTDPETEATDGVLPSQLKKRIGRPVLYSGDPNAPHLSEPDKRRIKRRISNRESARRVRVRRQEDLETLTSQLETQQALEGEVHTRMQAAVQRHEALCQQLKGAETRLHALQQIVDRLRQENASLRSLLAQQGPAGRQSPFPPGQEGASSFASPDAGAHDLADLAFGLPEECAAAFASLAAGPIDCGAESLADTVTQGL